VPLIIVSPFARPGYIFHKMAEFSSFAKFIEERFGLATISSRDAQTDDLFGASTFSRQPDLFGHLT